MGHTGRRRSAGIGAFLAAALFLLSTACGGGTPAISDLLLAPGDFPGRAFARTGFESGQTAQGQPTAIVELAGPGFTLQHSLVIFDEGVSARAALAGAKLQWEQLARNNDGTTLFRDDLAPLAIADRELVTGVLEEVRAGNVTSSLIFVQGSVLARLTISGTSGKELMPSYAEKARVKAAQR